MAKFEYMERAFSSELRPRARLVLQVLVLHCNKEGECFPSIKTIAAKCGYGISTVKRALDELVEAGYIIKQARFDERKNGGQTSNLYTLCSEEIGNPVYPPARRKLAEHGISCAGKTARQMTRRDYETYDYLIAMDHNNLRNMARFVGGDPEHKVSLLMDHTRRPGDVADPWYTGDFEATWQDVLEGCTALLEELR